MEKYLPIALLVSYLIRTLMFGAGVGDSVVMLGLSALYAASVWWQSRKDIPVNKAILDRLIALEESSIHTKDKVNALSLSSAFKK